MTTPPPARPRLLLYYFRFFALLSAIPFLIIVVDILLHPQAPDLTKGVEPVVRILFGLFISPLSLVIAFMCIRRAPSNLIGWLLLNFAYGIPVNVMRADLFPLGAEIVIANLLIAQFWVAFLLIPLYFPDGQLYPPRANRWGNPLLGFYLIFSTVVSNISGRAITWDNGNSQLHWPNPLFVVEWNLKAVTIPMLVFLLTAGIITVILRYRGSRELERLQLRWLLFGVLFQGAITILTTWTPPGFESIKIWTFPFYSLIIPLAIGIALLRYRLYDIDLIIRRTLQYGLLSVLLGLVYFGMVLLLEQAFRGLTGQESPLAVVLSTLAIVVLFNPLRRRIQTVIDRRFFRTKYAAAQAVASFSAAARSQVELDTLAGQLAAVAQNSLQPEGVWIWMRKDGTLKNEINQRSLQ